MLCCRVTQTRIIIIIIIIQFWQLSYCPDLLHDWRKTKLHQTSLLHSWVFISPANDEVPDCHLRSYASSDEVCNTHDLESSSWYLAWSNERSGRRRSGGLGSSSVQRLSFAEMIRSKHCMRNQNKIRRCLARFRRTVTTWKMIMYYVKCSMDLKINLHAWFAV